MAPPRNRIVVALLAFTFGFVGAHRYYLGHRETAESMLMVTSMFLPISLLLTVPWAAIEGVIALFGGFDE